MGIMTSPTSRSVTIPFGGQYHRAISWDLSLPISNKQKRVDTKNDNWAMRNGRPRRLFEEIKKNAKKLELTRTKSRCDL